MDLQLAKWRRRRSVLAESMWLLFVLLILVAIVVVAWWCWTKWLSLLGQVDTLLAIGVILNILQVMLGTARRRHTHWLVQYGAFVAFYFPVPVVASALSIMRSASHIETDLKTIIIRAQLINFAVSRRLDSMASYRLNDTVQRGMRHAQRTLYPLYWLHIVVSACWDEDNHLPSAHILTALLTAAYISSKLIVTNFQRIVIPHIISSYKSKKLAEYMIKEASHPHSFFDSDVTDMKNCRYPLEMRYDKPDQIMVGPRGNGREGSSVLAVVKDVLRLQHGRKNKTHIDQVCLSYSLFNMILRRHYGFPCAEQGNERVLEFVRKGFPAGQNDSPNESLSMVSSEVQTGGPESVTPESSAVQIDRPNESVSTVCLEVQTGGPELVSTKSSAVQNDCPEITAFKVIEVQLAFLHDHFFIERLTYYRPIALLLIIVPYLEWVVILSLTNIFFGVLYEDYVKCFFALATLVYLQEQIQFLFHRSSDWFQVWTVLQRCCGHDVPAEMKCNDPNTWLGRLFFMYHRQHWQNKIGQYSLIKDCDNISVKKTLIASLMRYLLDERYDFVEHHQLEMDSVSLPDVVKEAVFSSFHQSKGTLTNGVSSLKRNNVSELLSWTCNQPTHTDTILIWHVATWYCECEAEAEKGSGVSDSSFYKVATALSKYCAYLVAFLPEFLPEHSLTTTNVFQGVLKQAKELLDKVELENGFELGQMPRPRQQKFALIKALELPQEVASLTTFENGVRLGRQLNSLAGSAEDLELRRWKVMAEFWAETMVYVAPSDKVSAHIDQLAKGGEFVTHIWALLSDAGILERPAGVKESRAPPVDPTGGPPPSPSPNHEEAGGGTGISPW